MKRKLSIFARAFAFLLVCVFGMSSCYDDDDLKGDIADLQVRVASLEAWQKNVNSDIESLKTIVEALQNKNFITSVSPLTSAAGDTGYTILFQTGQSITIVNGKDGADGKDGVDGKDGINGRTPAIGVKQDADGVYYWTIDGEYLTDGNGNKMRVTGEKGDTGDTGEKGDAGKKGDDGITPQLRISDDNYWQISTDDGSTWTYLLSNGDKVKATGDTGEKGDTGDTGAKGDTGDSFFNNVDANNSEYVVFTLADGTTFTVPRSNGITVAFANAKVEIDHTNGSGTATVNFTGLTQDNYKAVYAELKTSSGYVLGVATRASSLKVTISNPDFTKSQPASTVSISNCNLADDAILRVTVVDNSGKETSASTVVETPRDWVNNQFDIYSVEDWNWVATNAELNGKTINLKADLDFNGKDCRQISTMTNVTFNGNNHTISNFTFTNNEGEGGIIREATKCTVKNLDISNATIVASSYAAAVIGNACDCTIEEIKVKDSKITAGSDCGGFVGCVNELNSESSVNGCLLENTTLKVPEGKEANPICGYGDPYQCRHSRNDWINVTIVKGSTSSTVTNHD